MRPGSKIRFWSPKYTHCPDVEPPGLLKAIAGLSVFSVVGFLLYGVAVSLSGVSIGPPTLMSILAGLYLAFLHFIVPMGVFYLVNANSPYSRHLIVIYLVLITSSVLSGQGVLGELTADRPPWKVGAVVAWVAAIIWLYATPKMRFYYALVSGAQVPRDLTHRADELHGGNWLSDRGRRWLHWFLDHMEFTVLVGFIVLSLYAVFRL